MSNKYVTALGIGLAVGTMCAFLFFLGFFSSWQLRLSDSLFSPRKPRPEIVIIAIDDKSIQAIGRWPWDRSVHAKLLDILGNKPAAIGLDVAFPEISNEVDDSKLKEAFKNAGNIVLPIEAGILWQDAGPSVKAASLLVPISGFREVTKMGLVNIPADPDGISRQVPEDIRFTELSSTGAQKSFAKLVLETYAEKNQLPQISQIKTENGYLRINFTGLPGTFPAHSYIDVLDGKVSVDTFKDKIVFIGATALDLHDTLITPVSGKPMSGVEVHANIIQTFLDKKYLLSEPKLRTVATIILFSLGASFIFASIGVTGGTIFLITLIGVYIFYVIFSFDQGVIRNLIFPLLTLVVLYVVHVIYKYFAENKRKRFIKKALSYYLSESVMKDVLSSPEKLKLGGQRKEITVLFSDIAGFTTISEKLPPEELARLLNIYLTNMTQIVFANSGVLDKYIGDAVMAFWGAPVIQKEHVLLACTAALKMQEEIQKNKIIWKKAGIDDFDVRIGVNTGEMVVGNMGSDLRFDYTLLGDNVNLGARLEGINKEYGTHIIIAESTYKQVMDHVIARRLDTVAVKGKKQGVTIYELRGIGQPADPEKLFLTEFEKARKLYEEGKFKSALKEFNILKNAYPHDGPIKVYVARCQELMSHQPKDWDGVFHAKSK